VLESSREDRAALKHLQVIGRVTGYEPTTCPWRAFYHPLVREVLAVMPMLELAGAAGSALPPNTPGILLDAIAHYRAAVASTQHEETKLRMAAAKREREAREHHR